MHDLRAVLFWIVALFTALAIRPSPSRADTGVSDERVSLPDGPGSIGGIGENVSVEGNMGLMRYAVPFRVPEGFASLTPSFQLSYSSGSGSSIVGIGWSMEWSNIERMTSKGLPEYGTGDRFAADGGSELVRVSSSDGAAVYRARFEAGFVRYTWRNVGDGRSGYWTAELPDGRVSYYGADHDGKLVPSARVQHPNGGVFRYELVETVDPFGHRIHYSYVTQDGYPLLDAVDYVHGSDGKPRFSIRFSYDARPDVISDGKPGFDLRLTRRLSEARVFSGSEQIRGYALEYEAEAISGGLSRLARVTETGRNGAPYPIRPSFGYSRALGGACTMDCEKPFVVDMGRLSGGVDMHTGNATLIDINGDSLPDVLDTTGGTHTFYLSVPATDGKPHFAESAVASHAQTSAFALNNPGVQALDVNGDGFTDLVSTKTGGVLCNDGSGDWNGSACMANAQLDFDLEDDPRETGESDPLHVRFFDYDNDKRIDVLRTTSDTAADVRRDDGAGFRAIAIQPIGATFDESTLQLADMNGDGLQDPVQLLSGGQLRFRSNLGRGVWGEWQTVSLPNLGEASLLAAQLNDINGDGLADVVSVSGNTLQYALNRNAARFDAPVTLTSAAVNGSIPETTSDQTVLFADMNGNGSDDVVWVSSDGRVQFLDLYPVKPNLLARIENGIGAVQTVEYGTSLAELARSGNWQYRLNNAMNVVKKLDVWTTLTGGDAGKGLHEVEEYGYRDGYYDGVEKQFRGFARVEKRLRGDSEDSQEPGLTVMRYDVGANDPYFNGLLLQTDEFAMDAVPLRSERTHYEDCSVAGLGTAELSPKVRHICATQTWAVQQERADEAEWASIETGLEYDGYGNVTRRSEHGIANRGTPESPKACAACASADDVACGEQCGGDETFTETEYIEPGAATGGKWFLNAPSRQVVYGQSGGPQQETRYFYDGPEFEGLASGQLRAGKQTRVLRRSGAGDDAFTAENRAAFDAHGNPIAELDPLGNPSDPTAHRRNYVYDASYGLNLIATDLRVKSDSSAYSLRREYAYESTWNLISESTEWMIVRDGEAQTARDGTRYRYDEQGRLARLIRPGDSDDAPTYAYSYDLADPVSSMHVVGRSQPGGETDSDALRCLDGRGRVVQTVTEIADGRYLADGFRELNSRGAIVREYQPYEQDSAGCARSAPSNVPFVAHRYDPLFRPVAMTQPDAELRDGKASVARTVYGPLSISQFDEEDSADDSPHANTPTIRRFDGEGRLIAIERSLTKDNRASTRLRYDSLDNLTGYVDAKGNTRTQEYDLLSRVVKVRDPNAGESTLEYDAAGNVVRVVDASGEVTRTTYDGVNRELDRWVESAPDKTRISRRYDAVECDDCTGLAGKLAEVRYPVVLGDKTTAGFDRFGYDSRRRRTYQARGLEGYTFETRRTFDGFDRLVITVYPDGQSLERRYDQSSRLTAIPGVLAEIEYDARDLPVTERYSNGASVSYRYDVRRQLREQTLSERGNKQVFGLTYTRDRAGNITRIDDETTDKRSDHIGRGASYAYDAWYRPTAATLAKGDEREERIDTRFDEIDNLLSRTSSAAAESGDDIGAYAYDAKHPNAATKLGALELAYDASGFMTRRGALELSWDGLDRLTRAKRGGTISGAFAYGDDGERVIKEEAGHVTYYISSDFEVRDGVSAIHPRVGQRQLARLESDALATTVLGDENGDERIDIADAVLARARATKAKSPVERLLAASARKLLYDQTAAKTLLHADRDGSVIAATSGVGALIAERAFGVTGQERASTGFVDDYGGVVKNATTAPGSFTIAIVTSMGKPAVGLVSILRLASSRRLRSKNSGKRLPHMRSSRTISSTASIRPASSGRRT